LKEFDETDKENVQLQENIQLQKEEIEILKNERIQTSNKTTSEK
jgi:hypothetical protein